MKKYILTGPPGSGKTTLLHALKRKGYTIVEEAATDVIAVEQANGILCSLYFFKTYSHD